MVVRVTAGIGSGVAIADPLFQRSIRGRRAFPSFPSFPSFRSTLKVECVISLATNSVAEAQELLHGDPPRSWRLPVVKVRLAAVWEPERGEAHPAHLLQSLRVREVGSIPHADIDTEQLRR